MQKEWFVYVRDKPGTYEQRMKVRDQHLANARGQFEKGVLCAGGGVADDFAPEGEKPQLKGSALAVLAESREDVIKYLKSDIYYTSGVWDVDNAIIDAVSSCLL
jgi:uncharacterized protein YciI